MARRVTKKGLAIVVAVVLAVGGVLFAEVYLVISRGSGYVFTRRLPKHAWAVRDITAIAAYCDAYAKLHGNARPSAALTAEHVPYVRLPASQPYVERGLWVLESVDSREVYLYCPYERREWHLRGPDRVYLCNVAKLAGPNGRYYVYTRDPEKDYHVVADYLTPCTDFVQTRGIPVVPGCTFEGPAGAKRIARMSPEVMERLAAYYPDVRVPPDRLKGQAIHRAERH